MVAKRVWAQHIQYAPDEFADLKVWAVEPSSQFPDGIKFSYVYAVDVGGTSVVRYAMDNAHGTGPHEHLGRARRPVVPLHWRVLARMFLSRVDELRGVP